MTKREVINKELVEKFREITEIDNEYLVTEFNPSGSMNYGSFVSMMNNTSKRKKFRIETITPLESKNIAGYSEGLSLGKNGLRYQNRTGLFKIKFSTGDIFLYANWYTGGGKSLTAEGLITGTKETWKKYLVLKRDYKKKSIKPKVGLHQIYLDNFAQLNYEPYTTVFEDDAIHQNREEVLNDVAFYFENTKEFLRYGMSGVRKLLMVGEPGSGKTTIAQNIADIYKTNCCVVNASNLNAVSSFMKSAAKHNVRSLVIIEDVEASGLTDNSYILNTLDGNKQPRNKAGTYILMTTNFPNAIEDRILRRPGRIDRIIKIGSLQGEYALACARKYFGGILEIKDDYVKIFNNMTGAQIKKIAQDTLMYVVSNKLDKPTIEVVKTVKSIYNKDMKEIEKYAKTESFNSNNKVGFNTQNVDVLDF